MTTINFKGCSPDSVEIANMETAEMLENVITEYYVLQDLGREVAEGQQSFLLEV